MQRADGSWVGLIIIVIAIASQAIKAMGRGKVEPLPPTVPRPTPAPTPRPQPVYRETALPSAPARSELPPRLRDLFETLSVPGGFPPGVPRPGSGPVYRPFPTPAPVAVEPPPLEVVAAIPRPTAEAFPSGPTRHGPRLDLLRLNNRQDWERAIILSEILQPPLALRSQGDW